MRTETAAPRRIRARWRVLAAVSGSLIVASLTPGLAGSAETSNDFVAGSGNAYAQVYRVGPTAARLSLAPVFGLSLADYVSTVGRGETKAADWAGIGVAECSLPQNTPELRVSSTDEGAAEGKRSIFVGQKDESGAGGGFVELFGRATDAPLGESYVRLGTMSVPGLIDVADSEAHTVVGVVDGKLRRSVSVVEIGRVDLASTVRLTGLRWEAVQTTGPNNEPKVSGKFTVQGVRIAGVPLPVPAGGSDFAAVLDPINSALAPTGFAISPPKLEERGGQASVSPLAFEIVNSPLGRQFLAPILAAAQPAREPITDLFVDLAKQLVATGKLVTDPFNEGTKECSDDTRVPEVPDLTVGILLADLTLGVFSGSAQLHIELGGVNAFTEGATFASPFGPAIAPPALPVQTIPVPGSPGTPPIPGSPGEEGRLVSVPGTPGTETVPGGRGGLALIVGLVGLFVAVGLASRDYWAMRRVRREAVTS